MKSDVFHLNGLNGIRAIAAFTVIFSHCLQSGGLFGLPHGYQNYRAGYFGVTIFFSLSGFLITYLLLIEKKKFQSINVKAFYVRRILRIWPLYYFYLAIATISLYIYFRNDVSGTLFYYYFLLPNVPDILGASLLLVSHYWSLGVEEQFYAFWPIVIKKIKNLPRFLCIFIIVFLLIKFGARLLSAQADYDWPYRLMRANRFDCMAIGALGAWLAFAGNTAFRKISFHIVTQVLVLIFFVFILTDKFHVLSVIDNDIIAVATVVLIMNVSGNAKSLIKLNGPVLDFLGKISYGLYVYQQLVIFYLGTLIGDTFNSLNQSLHWAIIIGLVTLLTILIAWLSYEYFEKRFLRLKEKFAAVPSTA